MRYNFDVYKTVALNLVFNSCFRHIVRELVVRRCSETDCRTATDLDSLYIEADCPNGWECEIVTATRLHKMWQVLSKCQQICVTCRNLVTVMMYLQRQPDFEKVILLSIIQHLIKGWMESWYAMLTASLEGSETQLKNEKLMWLHLWHFLWRSILILHDFLSFSDSCALIGRRISQSQGRVLYLLRWWGCKTSNFLSELCIDWLIAIVSLSKLQGNISYIPQTANLEL